MPARPLPPRGPQEDDPQRREPWLIEKLASMVGRTFGRDSFVSTYGGQGRGAVIVNGTLVARDGEPVSLEPLFAEHQAAAE
jgi:hypothetical protein